MNLYPVTKFFPYFSFTVYCFYTKISSFIQKNRSGLFLTAYVLFWETDVCRLPYVVNVNLNLSNVTTVDLSFIIVSIIIIITLHLPHRYHYHHHQHHRPFTATAYSSPSSSSSSCTIPIHIISIIINSNDTGIMSITMTTWIMAIWSFKKVFKSQQLCYRSFYILLGAWWRVTVWVRRFLDPWPPFLLLLKCKPENKQTKNNIYLTLLN